MESGKLKFQILLSLIVLIIAFHPSSFASSDLTVQCSVSKKDISSLNKKGKQWFKRARKVLDSQYAISVNVNYLSEQEWTLNYQSLIKGQKFTYYANLVRNPAYLTSQRFQQAYIEMYENVERLISELPEMLDIHYSLNPEEYKGIWLNKVQTALSTMQSDLLGNDDYQMSDCNVVSQPLNYLWYALHTLKIMDQLGQANDCSGWLEKTKDHRSLLEFDPSTIL